MVSIESIMVEQIRSGRSMRNVMKDALGQGDLGPAPREPDEIERGHGCRPSILRCRTEMIEPPTTVQRLRILNREDPEAHPTP